MKLMWLLIFALHSAFAIRDFELREINSKLIVWEVSDNQNNSVSNVTKNISYNPANSYIVLLTEKGNTYNNRYIYYLIPRKSKINTKLITVEHVVKLRKFILEKVPKSIPENVSIIREHYTRESYKLKKIFPLQGKVESIPLQRLYRISKINEQVSFQQVPLNFSELNLTDSFVLDNGNSVILFSAWSEHLDNTLGDAAKRLGYFIYMENEYENATYTTEILQNCLQWSPENDECYSRFIAKLRGYPVKNLVISRILNNKSGKIPQNFYQYRVYKPSEENKIYVEPDFMMDYTQILSSMTEACYIFIIEKIQEAFIYIRDHNNEKQVEKCLKFGELYAEDSNYLVSIVQKERLTAPFIIIFKQFWSFFLLNNIPNNHTIKEKINLILH